MVWPENVGVPEMLPIPLVKVALPLTSVFVNVNTNV